MIKIINVIIYLIFSINICICNTNDVDHYIDKGINHLYNYQIKLSQNALDSAHMIDNLHPLPPFLLIVTVWLYKQTEIDYQSSYDAINQGVDNLIPKYKTFIDKFPDNPEYLLYLGSANGLKARIALASKNWLDVLYYGYQGSKLIYKARELDSLLYDAYMPIGLLQYYSCISSKPIQFISSLLGIIPDCNEGIKNLEIAFEKSKYSWIESGNVLTYIYLYLEKDYVNSLRTISPLIEGYPLNPFFHFLKAETLAKLNRWQEVHLMHNQLEIFTVEGPFLQKNECKLKNEHLKALNAFYNKNYLEVIEITTWMIDNYHMEFDWLLGFAYILRGKSYDLLNKRKLAIRDYKFVINLDNYFPEINESKDLLRSPYELN